jgi:hypothetical protein
MLYSTHPRATESRIRRLARQHGLVAYRRGNLWYFRRGHAVVTESGLPVWKAILWFEDALLRRAER